MKRIIFTLLLLCITGILSAETVTNNAKEETNTCVVFLLPALILLIFGLFQGIFLKPKKE